MLLASVAVLGALRTGSANFALSIAPAFVVCPFIYTQLQTSVGLGIAVFGEVPDFWTLSGAGIIACSGIYTLYREQIVVRRASA